MDDKNKCIELLNKLISEGGVSLEKEIIEFYLKDVNISHKDLKINAILCLKGTECINYAVKQLIKRYELTSLYNKNNQLIKIF